MRLFWGSLTLPLLVLFVVGCSTVSPDECWVNTSGGFGGEEPIPIGAGVGATTGGDFADPSRGPLDNGGAPYNPCVEPETPETPEKPEKPPSQSTCELPTPAAEGASSWSCSEECSAKCSPHVRITYVTFSPSEFPFVTIVKDDGEGDGGGWQEAKVNLEFIDAIVPRSVRRWYCPFNIEIAIRTKEMGKISARRAADISVEMTESVARGMNYDLPAGPFCTAFILGLRAAFKSDYPYSGARVTL